jgi:hypothetical protein
MRHFVANRRENQRGAAVFIVVMVVTLLTAVGIFAARSASLVDVASGHNRHSMQTQYVSEYGAVLVSHELSTAAVSTYVLKASRRRDDCMATKDVNTSVVGPAFCYSFQSEDLQDRFNQPFFAAAASDIAGSLDPFDEATQGELGAQFVVDMTEGIQAGNVRGTDLTSGDLVPLRVTLTARGFVSPPSSAGNAAQVCQEEMTAGGIQEVRAHLTLPSVMAR